METTLGLIVGEGTSSSVSKMEQDYSTDTCTSESSSYISDETEIELRLGLGLSCGGGGGVTKAKKSTRSREYGRILTANDRPNGFKGGVNNNVASVSGIKRGADSVGSSSEISGLLPRVSRQVVGWPPIRTYRMNSLVNQSKVTNVEQEKLVEGNEKEENSKKKINHENTKNDVATIKENDQLGFVKVNMNGLPITRMVDLNAHYCYDTLAKTLEEMFFKSTISHEKKEELPKSYKLLDGSSEFVLTYEDKDGDWMLVGDVPWGMFLSTVERLEIMRTSEASGVGM